MAPYLVQKIKKPIMAEQQQWLNGKIKFADKKCTQAAGVPIERVVLKEGPPVGKSDGYEQTVLLVFYQRTTDKLNVALSVQAATNRLVVAENSGEFTKGDVLLKVGSSRATAAPVANDPEQYYAAVHDSILHHHIVAVYLSRSF